MQTPILQVQNLRKSFDGVAAVKDVSFDVAQGEVFGLLGPNGAGKTTTIQMLLGVVEPDGGEIRVFGKSLARHREEILGQMNFSSSYVSLPWNLTVEENLEIIARLYSVQHRREKIAHLVETLDLAKVRRTRVGKLSSGQLTRVFLAKALVNDPRVLLLDEPTASLDPDIAERVRTLLKRLVREQGMTLLYTSHNMLEMERMCDRLAFLHHGRILAVDTTASLAQSHGRGSLEEFFIAVSRGDELAEPPR